MDKTNEQVTNEQHQVQQNYQNQLRYLPEIYQVENFPYHPTDNKYTYECVISTNCMFHFL